MAQNRYEKHAKSQSPLSKLFAYLSPEKGKIIVGIIFAIFSSLLLLAAPLILQEINKLILGALQDHSTTVDQTKLWIFVFVGLGLFTLSGVFNYIQIFIVAGVCARCGQRLRKEMTTKINHLPLNYFDTRNIGDVLSYLSNDVDIIGTTLNQSLSSAISSTVTLVGVIIILFVLQWTIGLAALIFIPVVLLILVKIGNVSQKHFLERQKLTSVVSSEAEESFAGFNIIRIFNAKEMVRNKFAANNYKLEKATGKADYYAGMMIPLMTMMGNLLFCIVAVLGGILAVRLMDFSGKLITFDIGSVALVVTAVTYADQIVSPLNQIAQTAGTFQQTIASSARVFDFLEQVNEPDESNKTLMLDKVEGNINFEHVRFGYTSDRVIIHDFSEKGKSGQKIAIVGPTGAGKTTMVNLLMRFYEINSGKITIEGVDTRLMNRSYVRSLFGMVLQDTWLFEGTIMENLKYSRPDASDEEVYEACRATHCDTFILQQPGGYNHILNEDCGLSAGQKQLLTIARAMIQNAPMLILDEATSSVDTRTELLIQDAMDKLMKGRTSFVIAHRLSTIKNSDLIIVMKDGDVLETGNHDELMKLDGFYATLYNSQFTGKGPQFS